MNNYGYALIGFVAIVGTLAVVVVFALLRFMVMATGRDAKRQARGGGTETALLSTALHDALAKLAAQERAMSARATASEQLSAQVFDSLTAGLIVVDHDGRVTIANPAAQHLLSGLDATGRDYREALAAAAPLADVIGEGLSAGTPIVRRALQVDIGGRTWHFGVTVSPLGDAGGPRGAICLFSDLTNVVELEYQLQLKEALARLGELTAGIAHEFRNGLATIHGYSRLIDTEAIEPRFRPCVEGIRQETDTLGRVVTNFLNFARPEQVMLAPVDLESIARASAADLEGELPSGATLEPSGSYGRIDGDEVMLRQLFVNLIRNAIEACQLAGVTPAIAIQGTVDRTARLAHVSVTDNGPGIPEAHRGRIFQPFFTTRSRGSGLGLSIVQKIALLHNGTVSVGAAAGGGAQINVVFPISTSAASGDARKL